MRRCFTAALNWGLLLSAPVWGGPVLWVVIGKNCYENPNRRQSFMNLLTGKRDLFNEL